MNPNPSDPVIDEIRELRRRISERCAHDPARLVAYYAEFQKQYRDRLIDDYTAEREGLFGQATLDEILADIKAAAKDRPPPVP